MSVVLESSSVFYWFYRKIADQYQLFLLGGSQQCHWRTCAKVSRQCQLLENWDTISELWGFLACRGAISALGWLHGVCRSAAVGCAASCLAWPSLPGLACLAWLAWLGWANNLTRSCLTVILSPVLLSHQHANTLPF